MAETLFLGIDPSWTGFAMCAGSSIGGGDFDIHKEHRISTKPDKFPDHFKRLDYIGEQFMEFIDTVFPEFVAIEGYARNKKNGREEAGELGGHIRWLLMKAGIPFIDVPPTTLKKFVTGKGTGKKELMMMHALKRWGYESVDNDACDAYGLMRFAWQHQRPSNPKSFQAMVKQCEVLVSSLAE